MTTSKIVPDASGVPLSSIAAVNVATVPQRSPLRYPGGKTWLIPHIRYWLEQADPPAKTLFEPFAGGATVTLTAVMEGFVERAIMAELDRDVASFWHVALRSPGELIEQVQQFRPTRFAVNMLAARHPRSLMEHGFRTLVLNRTRRGGILAPGAALARAGENGRGITSRWYPETLIDRIEAISRHRHRISFCETDGLMLLETLLPNMEEDNVVFADPPYTAGGKRAGSRLYAHNELDHVRLFSLLAESNVNFLMTYDCAPEILALVKEHGFEAVQVVMKNTHHRRVPELVITRTAVFGASG
jgi:DNA adenine methylase